MALSTTSEAAVVGASVKNVQFAPAAANVPRKIGIIATYDSGSITTVDEETPVQVLSPEDAGARFGFGFMAHRLVKAAWTTANGVPVYVIPQAEPSGAQATGTIAVSGTATESGVLYLRVSGDSVPVTVTKGDTATVVGDAIAAALAADNTLPVTGANTTGTVTVTAKTTGTFGNDIGLSLNDGVAEETPAGLTVTITAMASGSGTPDIQDALDGLGTEDTANDIFITDLVHGYLQDSTTLDKISAYNGEGNDFVGLYAKTVARPFRCLTGDVQAGSSGFTALTDASTGLGPSRKATDRTNGCVAVPGSPNHPSEIAAIAIGLMARRNNERAAQHYAGEILPGVIPGAKADQWTSSHASLDAAVKAGISPTRVQDGAVELANVVTFYRPTNVPVSSNGYKDMENISKLQNILYNLKLNFSSERWKGTIIVQDVTKVSSAVDSEKARDTGAVTDDLLDLADQFEALAWIYTAAFTKERLKAGLVQVRAGGSGFDAQFPIVLSGNGRIIDIQAQFDTSLTVLDQ